MGLTYFDSVTGRNRIKRRYVWGAWGYAAGMISVAVIFLTLMG
ncbi:hypothetical protein [Solimonas sp. K1W22B-7]|nr:hypothetical protein [Solimonas sp. K1W22B-7]